MWTCRKCGETDITKKAARNPECRTCRAAYMKTWRDNNKEYVLAKERERYASKYAKRKESGVQREYYLRHKTDRRVYERQKKFGLTPEAFETLLIQQEGKCAVCREVLDEEVRNGLNVDHCHDSAIVRGLLCSPCNVGIGMFKNSAERLMAAAMYIEAFEVRRSLVEEIRG